MLNFVFSSCPPQNKLINVYVLIGARPVPKYVTDFRSKIGEKCLISRQVKKFIQILHSLKDCYLEKSFNREPGFLFAGGLNSSILLSRGANILSLQTRK